MAHFYLNSTSNTSVNWIIWILLTLLCWPEVILLSGGHCIVIVLNNSFQALQNANCTLICVSTFFICKLQQCLVHYFVIFKYLKIFFSNFIIWEWLAIGFFLLFFQQPLGFAADKNCVVQVRIGFWSKDYQCPCTRYFVSITGWNKQKTKDLPFI